MANEKTLTPTLELVYVPDTYTDTERQEGASWPLGSGHYNLFVVVEGARVLLHSYKAGIVDKQLALAKDRREAQQQQAATSPPPSAPPAQQQQTSTPLQQPPADQQQAPPTDQQQQQQQG